MYMAARMLIQFGFYIYTCILSMNDFGLYVHSTCLLFSEVLCSYTSVTSQSFHLLNTGLTYVGPKLFMSTYAMIPMFGYC